MNRGTVQVSGRVQQKTPRSNGHIDKKDQPRQTNEMTRDRHCKWHNQKSDSNSARNNWRPFHEVKEPILRVIGQAENEVANVTAESKKQNPLAPFKCLRIDHAIHNQEKPQPCIRERGSKWGGICQAAQGTFIEKTALQMKDNAGEPNQYRQPAHEVSQVSPNSAPTVTTR